MSRSPFVASSFPSPTPQRTPTMTRSLRLLLLAALPALSGCWAGMVKPMQLTPLTTYAQVPAPDGGRLGLTPDGTLLHYPPVDDIEGALGATLAADPAGGLRVTQRLIAETPLHEGERVLAALALRPSDTAALSSASALKRVREDGHPVSELADLRGYTRAPVRLVLLVEREGNERAVEAQVGEPRLLSQRLWRPDLTRKAGFSGCRLDELFPNHEGDLGDTVLVTWVAEGGKAARDGVRPLSLLQQNSGSASAASGRRPYERSGPQIDLGDPLLNTTPSARAEVRGGLFSGALLHQGLGAPGSPTNFDLLGGGLGALSVQTNWINHTIVTVGPLGYALTYNAQATFDPAQGEFVETSNLETKYVFESSSVTRGERGEQSTVTLLSDPDDWLTWDNEGDDATFYFFEGE